MDNQDLQIVNAICALGDFTSSQLSEKLHISDRNTRERLKRLKPDLQSNGGQLCSKTGKGYSFHIVHKEKFTAWLNSKNKSNHFPSTSPERADYILDALIQADGFLKLDDLCEELSISRTTITTDMKQVKGILQNHHLTLVQRPGFGIRISGNELEFRNCMAYNLIRKEHGIGKPQWIVDDKRRIIDSMAYAFKKQNLTLSKQSFLELLFYLAVATERIQSGHHIVFNEDRMSKIKENVGTDILQAAQKVCQDIFKEENGINTSCETAGFALLIQGKGVFRQDPSPDMPTSLPGHLEQLSKDMLNLVFEMYGFDFRNDEELLSSLTQHLVSFDVRMRYNLILSNPLLEQIKKEYSVSYNIATSACIVLQKAYGQSIPDAEIGYFAILFALADQKKGLAPCKNVLIVCVSGQATSRLFMHRFKEAFETYVNRIYTCSAFQLSSFDFVGRKIDAVFTTVPLDIELPVPVFQVSLLLTEQEIHVFRQIMKNTNQGFLPQYFKESLFFGRIALSTKEEILRFMCDSVKKITPLPDDFLQCVLEREKMGQTDFGNLVAIPHPCRIMGTKKFVSVAVLDNPIWWGRHDVQVVFLISLEQNDTETENLFGAISDFMSSPTAAKTLIQHPTYQTLIEELNRSK